MYAYCRRGEHTESQEDTSNLLESGEKHRDEIPSAGGWSDRSGHQHHSDLRLVHVDGDIPVDMMIEGGNDKGRVELN